MNVKFWRKGELILLALALEIVHFESFFTTRNWEKVTGTNLQEKKIWNVSNINTCIPAPKNLMN